MFKCNQCAFQGDYKQNLKRHMKNMHEKNTPTTKDEDTPKALTAMHVGIQHGLGTGEAQDNQTVSIQEYNNIIDETYKWKDAYEKQMHVNIVKDNAVKIRDIQLLKLNNKLLTETNKNKELVLNNDDKVSAMGKDMRMLINKYKILKKKKSNTSDNKNGQMGYGMEDDSSEYGYGDTDEETVDDSEHSNTEEFDGKVDYDMDSENGDVVDSEVTDDESMDASEQSEDMNDDEINNRAPDSVFKSINTPTYPSSILEKDGNEVEFTYGAAYYEFRTGSGIGGILRARYRRGIGGLLNGC